MQRKYTVVKHTNGKVLQNIIRQNGGGGGSNACHIVFFSRKLGKVALRRSDNL